MQRQDEGARPDRPAGVPDRTPRQSGDAWQADPKDGRWPNL